MAKKKINKSINMGKGNGQYKHGKYCIPHYCIDCGKKITPNAKRCKKCGDIIESTYRYDFVTCKCGSISVDGGKDYLKRSGNLEDYEDLSEVRKD